ncbi:MAG TPA: GYD domain-containing protein [bacterium]|nr:GYD domain-containing protein [bacterium]
MPKFLIHASYTSDGIKGILKGGGSARRAAAQQACESVDGRLEAFYFAFGEHDVYAIIDAPDSVSMAAAALAINASGAVHTRTTALLTPEEIDQAAKKRVRYSPPGQT